MSELHRIAEQWVPVARLLRPQGRRGELLAEPLTDIPEVLAPGVELRLSTAEGVTLDSVWHPTGRNAGRVVLKLRGCDDISAAEAYAGKQLLVSADRLPALDADTFYVRDLLGCTLWDADQAVGEITDVQFVTTTDGRQRLPDAAPLLEVHVTGTADGQTVLVPFVRAFLLSVDLTGQKVKMKLPGDLLRSADSATDPLS